MSLSWTPQDAETEADILNALGMDVPRSYVDTDRPWSSLLKTPPTLPDDPDDPDDPDGDPLGPPDAVNWWDEDADDDDD